MKRRLKEPFGKAGLTVAVIALVLALIGGAYAAGGLTKSQEKQVTKIAKKYAGKPGATGPAGPAGTNGTNGTNGAAGKNGTNGTNGTNGQEGSPWTAGGTLPSGATETGHWDVSFSKEVGARVLTPISFTIPLAAPLSNEPECGEPGEPTCQVHYIGSEPGTAECPGSYEEPEAEPGNLCVYMSGETNIGNGRIAATMGGVAFGVSGTLKSGAILALPVSDEEQNGFGNGSWAVTAE